MSAARNIKLFIPLLLLASLVAVLTWNVRARAAAATQSAAQDPVAAWLGASAQERTSIAQRDPKFDDDLKQLRTVLESKRSSLAALLEKTDTSDQAIRAEVEAVISANAALQRRVMEHVLVVRDQLTAAQQQRLLNLCAEGIRQGPGWGWGRGGTGGMGGGPLGEPRGAGAGQGAGRGLRGGRGTTTRSSG